MLHRKTIHGFVQAAWSKQRGIKRFAGCQLRRECRFFIDLGMTGSG
jgi:hypothetical protein